MLPRPPRLTLPDTPFPYTTLFRSDRPLPVQYVSYLGRLAQGDMGRSYIQRTEVSTLIWSRLPATLQLMAGAIVFELLIGIPAGIIAAARRDRKLDRVVMVGSFVGASAPQFVVGILLLYVFAARSEEHTSELQSLMRISYAVFCLKKKK